MGRWKKFKQHWFIRKTQKVLSYSIIMLLFSFALGAILGDVFTGYLVVASFTSGWKFWAWAREEFQYE